MVVFLDCYGLKRPKDTFYISHRNSECNLIRHPPYKKTVHIKIKYMIYFIM